MLNPSKEERTRVIELYRQDLEEDLAVQGPMYLTLRKIAYFLVHSGRRIALECWCAPLPCHADLLVPVIIEMAEEIQNQSKHSKDSL
jgi:hypothetical protein